MPCTHLYTCCRDVELLLDDVDEPQEHPEAEEGSPELLGEEGKKSRRARSRSGAVNLAAPKKGRTTDKAVAQDPDPEYVLKLINASPNADKGERALHHGAGSPLALQPVWLNIWHA